LDLTRSLIIGWTHPSKNSNSTTQVQNYQNSTNYQHFIKSEASSELQKSCNLFKTKLKISNSQKIQNPEKFSA